MSSNCQITVGDPSKENNNQSFRDEATFKLTNPIVDTVNVIGNKGAIPYEENLSSTQQARDNISQISTESNVYFREDGKLVRRVKRIQKVTSSSSLKSTTSHLDTQPVPLSPGATSMMLMPTPIVSPNYQRNSHDVAVSVVTTSLNAIDAITNEKTVTSDNNEIKNPWTTDPSFEESIFSSDKSHQDTVVSYMDVLGSFPKQSMESFQVPVIADRPLGNVVKEKQVLPIPLHPTPNQSTAQIPVSSVATVSDVNRFLTPSKSRDTVQAAKNEVQAPPTFIDTPVRSNARQPTEPNGVEPLSSMSIPACDVDVSSPISTKVAQKADYHDDLSYASSSSHLDPEKTWSNRLGGMSPRGFRLPESVASRTRSRVELENMDCESVGSHRSFHQMTDTDAIVLHATFAQKRVKVVQLLFFGLVGILLGYLGSFFVQSSCHFLNVSVVVGADAEVFVLHYGLWKYTPIDSAYQGYSYCTQYDDEYTSDIPLIPRVAGICCMVSGAYALIVLWTYLIFGKATYKLWNWAIVMATLACLGQALTFSFITGSLCKRYQCSLGPGGYLSLFSSLGWFILAFEMYYNKPMSMMMSHISPGGPGGSVMTTLEMKDFSKGARAYFQRLSSTREESLPTLNELQRKRDGTSSFGRGMMDLNSIKRSGSYKPPIFA